MDQLQDPSIITIDPVIDQEKSLQPQDFINRAMEEEIRGKQQQDNAITKFLRDAETKREKEEVESGTTQGQSASSTSTASVKKKDPLNDMKTREFHIEDWEFEFNNQSLLRYLPSQLLAVRANSASIIVPENLPPKSFYRLRSNNNLNQNNNNNNNNNNNRNRQNYNSRNFTDGTGSMGNFNLGKRHHNERGNRRRGGRHNKKQDDDSWLEQFEGDGPVGTADDFEKWKARVNNEERKKRGEFVPDQIESNDDYENSAKNTIDSFFSSGGLSSVKSSQSSSSQTKNSKFFSFFKAEESQQSNQSSANSNKDGVSKILSFLDKGEKSAASEIAVPQLDTPSNNSPQKSQQQSRSQFDFASFQNTQSPSISTNTTQFPPGLGPEQQNSQPSTPGAQTLPTEKGRESFFMSLLQKNDSKPGEQEQNNQAQPSKPEHHQQQHASGPKPDLAKQGSFSQQQQQQQQLPQQLPKDQPLQGFPPGFQVPPGFAPPRFQNPQGALPRGQLPPGFENANEKGPQNNLPPGFPPNQGGLPPWLTGQQIGIPPPHLQQFQLPNGQFLPPPNGNMPPGLAPPHLRQQQQRGGLQQKQGQQPGQQQSIPGGIPNNGGFPPHLVYGRPGPNGQIPPPMFFQGKEGEQQGQQNQGRFPPGFFNAPPPGLIPPPGQGQQAPPQQQQQGK